MKKVLVLAVLAGLMSISCKEKEKEQDVFKVSASQPAFPPEGGSFSVQVSTNMDFVASVREGKEWIIPVKTKAVTDYQLIFEITPNDDTEKRQGLVVITSGQKEESFVITQSGVPPVLTVAGGEDILPAEGGSFTVQLTSNGEPDVDVGASWIRRDQTKAVTQKQLAFLVDPNPNSDIRQATLYFRWKDLRQTLTVTQAMSVKYAVTPGFYGLAGLGWTYEPQKMQLLVREQDHASEKIFALIEPAGNRLIQVRYKIEGAIERGTSVVATIIQNVDPERPSYQGSVKATIKSLDGPFIVLEDAQGREAVIKQ